MQTTTGLNFLFLTNTIYTRFESRRTKRIYFTAIKTTSLIIAIVVEVAGLIGPDLCIVARCFCFAKVSAFSDGFAVVSGQICICTTFVVVVVDHLPRIIVFRKWNSVVASRGTMHSGTFTDRLFVERNSGMKRDHGMQCSAMWTFCTR